MQNASFDTSFLTKSHSGEVDIHKYFPSDLYTRWIHDTVFDEFFYDHKNNQLQSNWRDRENFYKSSNLKVFGEAQIISDEYDKGSKCTILRATDSNKISALLNKNLPNQAEIEKSYAISRQERTLAKKSQWDRDSIKPSPTDNEIKIDYTDFNNEIQSIINNNETSSKKTKEIINLILTDYYKKSPISIIKSIKDYPSELPTFYNIIKYDLFIKKLKRPKDITKRSSKNLLDPFNIKPSSEFLMKNHFNNSDIQIKHIELSVNIVPDFRISIIALHYIDLFATCDKNLAALLIYLYPQYKSKIRYYKPIVT